MMSCVKSQRIIENWDIRGDHLSEAVVLHMDGCEVCLDRFDARFQPISLEESVEVPSGLMERLMPKPVVQNTWRWPLVTALAALFLGGISVMNVAPEQQIVVQAQQNVNLLAMTYLDEVEQLVALGEYEAALDVLAKVSALGELNTQVLTRMSVLRDNVEVELLVVQSASEEDGAVDIRQVRVRPTEIRSPRRWLKRVESTSSSVARAVKTKQAAVSVAVTTEEPPATLNTIVQRPVTPSVVVEPIAQVAQRAQPKVPASQAEAEPSGFGLPVRQSVRFRREIGLGLALVERQLLSAGFSEQQFGGIMSPLKHDLEASFVQGTPLIIYPKASYYLITKRLAQGLDVPTIAEELRRAHHRGVLRAGLNLMGDSEGLLEEMVVFARREKVLAFNTLVSNVASRGLERRAVARAVEPLRVYWISYPSEARLTLRAFGDTLVAQLRAGERPEQIGRRLRRASMLQLSQPSARRDRALHTSESLDNARVLRSVKQAEQLFDELEGALLEVGFSKEQVAGLYRVPAKRVKYGIVSTERPVSVSPKELFDLVVDRYLVGMSRGTVSADLVSAARSGALY